MKDELTQLREENHILRLTLKNKNFVQIVENYDKLEQENKELKEIIENYRIYGSSSMVKPSRYTDYDYDQLVTVLEVVKTTLEFYEKSWIDPLKYPDLKYDSSHATRGIKLIEEALQNRVKKNTVKWNIKTKN